MQSIRNWKNTQRRSLTGSTAMIDICQMLFFEVANPFIYYSASQFVSDYEICVVQKGMVNLHTGSFLKPSIEETIEFFKFRNLLHS
jgi:hypothetical protein